MKHIISSTALMLKSPRAKKSKSEHCSDDWMSEDTSAYACSNFHNLRNIHRAPLVVLTVQNFRVAFRSANQSAVMFDLNRFFTMQVRLIIICSVEQLATSRETRILYQSGIITYCLTVLNLASCRQLSLDRLNRHCLCLYYLGESISVFHHLESSHEEAQCLERRYRHMRVETP